MYRAFQRHRSLGWPCAACVSPLFIPLRQLATLASSRGSVCTTATRALAPLRSCAPPARSCSRIACRIALYRQFAACDHHARPRLARSDPGAQCARRADQRGSARDLRRLQHRHPGQPQGYDQSSAAECVVEAPGALTSQPSRAVALLPRRTGPSRTGPRSASASRSTSLRSSPRAFSSSASCRLVQR